VFCGNGERELIAWYLTYLLRPALTSPHPRSFNFAAATVKKSRAEQTRWAPTNVGFQVRSSCARAFAPQTSAHHRRRPSPRRPPLLPPPRAQGHRLFPNFVVDNWSAAWKVRRHFEDQTELRKARGLPVY